jgi:hypothetical protein
MPRSDFEAVFDRLRALLQPYESRFRVTADTDERYALDAPPSPRFPQYPDGVFLGAAQINKRYVSFHLMPVYAFPDLLDGVSDRLRRRMQGKSCFNFTAADDDLFAELESLTGRAVERWQQEIMPDQ